MATRKLNRLATQVAKLTSPLPAAYKPWGYTFAFDMMVRIAPSPPHVTPSHIAPSLRTFMCVTTNSHTPATCTHNTHAHTCTHAHR